MITDPISDMLTRIRHASTVHKPEVLVPYSNLKFEIAKALKHADYIDGVEKVEEGKMHHLSIRLKYNDRQPAISHLQRVSRPGLRIYAKHDELPRVLDGFGVAILSTPRGVMTNKQAHREGVGGEVLCEVW